MRCRLAGMAAVLAGASAACSLLTDTSGLTSTAITEDASTTSDASSDAQPTDAAIDAGTDGALADAASDGFVGSDASDAGLLCPAGSMVICDAFERTNLQGPWGDTQANGGGQIALVTEAPRQFLRVTSPAVGGAVDVNVELKTSFQQVATSAYYEYDFRYSGLPSASTDDFEVQTIYFKQGGSAYSDVFLGLRSSGVVIYEQDFSNGRTTPVSISPGAWHHVAMEVHIGGALIVLVDGNVVVSKPAASFLSAGTASVSAGIAYESRPPSAVVVDIDNLVFRATP